jgi:hypothetical protein
MVTVIPFFRKSESTLALLVPWILADDANHTATLDHAAFGTHLLHRCPNLHLILLPAYHGRVTSHI